MNVHDPDSWPKNPSLYYRRISHAHPTAHAFVKHVGLSAVLSFCGTVSLAPDEGAIPTKFYTWLCSKCIGALRAQGYLSRSEAVYK